MTREYVYNRVEFSRKESLWENYFGLTFAQDPRPRCSLIVGDGFTQSFLSAQGLSAKLRCSIEDHFPPPSDLKYTPVEGDSFESSTMWDAQKWPRLYKLWQDSNQLSGRDFYLSLPKDVINPHTAINRLSYDSASIGFELRCYLWHLFRSHHYQWRDTKIIPGNWEWFNPFKLLLSEFAVGITSFNYDLLVEQFLRSIFRCLIVHHDLYPEHEYNRRPADSIALFKLHGSISYYLSTGMSALTGNNANPWLSDFTLGMNEIKGVNLVEDVEMARFPEFPDIVPPGHYGGDKISPQSTVLSLSKCHIGASKLVVFCGLSAEEPDTVEVQELVSKIDSSATVIQVGLRSDENNRLSQLLQERGLKRKFVLPEQLIHIVELVGAEIELYHDWSHLLPA